MKKKKRSYETTINMLQNAYADNRIRVCSKHKRYHIFVEKSNGLIFNFILLRDGSNCHDVLNLMSNLQFIETINKIKNL